MNIESKIRTIADYPKKGIMFRDITTLLKDAVGFRLVIDQLAQHYQDHADIDVIVGIEARGFILGGALAYNLGKGFVPIRKSGKLPAAVVTQRYDLEYGTDQVEIHQDALDGGKKVLLVDDLLATGGTALAAAALIEKLGGQVLDCAFVVNLPDLGGAQQLTQRGYSLHCLTEFSGE